MFGELEGPDVDVTASGLLEPIRLVAIVKTERPVASCAVCVIRERLSCNTMHKRLQARSSAHWWVWRSSIQRVRRGRLRIGKHTRYLGGWSHSKHKIARAFVVCVMCWFLPFWLVKRLPQTSQRGPGGHSRNTCTTARNGGDFRTLVVVFKNRSADCNNTAGRLQKCQCKYVGGQ